MQNSPKDSIDQVALFRMVAAVVLMFWLVRVAAADELIEAPSTLRTTDVKEESSKHKALSLDFLMELRARDDLRRRPQTSNAQTLHEVSLGGRYQFDRTVAAELEISVEQIGNESRFFAKQAFIDWMPWRKVVSVQLGQQFLPVGLISPRDNWFSSNPPFMKKLFADGKAIDLGVTGQIFPLQSALVFLEAGVFSGQFVREEDQRREDADSSPKVLSLKSESEFHKTFVSFFEHDLAFYDPVRAFGAGIELHTPKWKGLSATALIENWRFEQIQKEGPDERSEALVLLGQVEWNRFTLGYRWSEATARVVSTMGSERLPLESSRLAFLDLKLAPVFAIRAERVRDQQDSILRDEWVGRAILQWSN